MDFSFLYFFDMARLYTVPAWVFLDPKEECPQCKSSRGNKGRDFMLFAGPCGHFLFVQCSLVGL